MQYFFFPHYLRYFLESEASNKKKTYNKEKKIWKQNKAQRLCLVPSPFFWSSSLIFVRTTPRINFSDQLLHMSFIFRKSHGSSERVWRRWNSGHFHSNTYRIRTNDSSSPTQRNKCPCTVNSFRGNKEILFGSTRKHSLTHSHDTWEDVQYTKGRMNQRTEKLGEIHIVSGSRVLYIASCVMCII